METKKGHGISIVACTNKEGYMDNIFSNYQNQLLHEKELIVILNSDSHDLNQWLKKAKNYKHVRVFQLPEETTLGSCLNFGIDKANFKFVAKWDDDDYYGPAYLFEALRTFENTNADILGKRTIFMYFPETKELRLRFPGCEFKFVKRVLGGTLIAKKIVMQEVPFLNISLHEDSNFIKNARAKGYRIRSTSRYNYVYFRWDSNKHTWKPTKRYLNRTSQHIDYMDDFKKVVDQDIELPPVK